MQNVLYTRWGRELDPERVLQEYPRPTLVRESYINLNGLWDYAFTKTAELPAEYDGKILVPFSPEAPLSGVDRQLMPGEFLHYRRRVSLGGGCAEEAAGQPSERQTEQPSERQTEQAATYRPGGRWLLHFGAVDQICTVYINGARVGDHTGGYLPFSFDVTEYLHEGDNLLQLAVQDFSDTSYHAKGKQSLERGGMWYTAQSGIWQTVWLEQVPDRFIREIKITPDYDRGEIRVKVLTNAGGNLPVHAVILFQGEKILETDFLSDKSVRIALEDFRSWTPETPDLYDMELHMGEDCVSTYFAMRKISVQRDAGGILRFFLNNRPYFHKGLLDQGYYPDGLYTAPSDEALQYDIRKMKSLGFNMLRKHIKIEPERWYYHCDKLGMLVWQDMVCGGSRYLDKFVTVLPNVLPLAGRVIRDSHYRLFSRQDAEGRAEYYRELKETIRCLYAHPSIVVWVPFNEGWGQFDARKATAIIRKLDPDRLIDEASGWFDQGGGDMYSIHNYFRKLRVRPLEDRVVALTECGGYSYRIPEHSVCGKVYGYRKYFSREELTAGVAGLWEKELIPAVSRGLSAVVYTQVSDVEDEVNGLLTWDREECKVDEEEMRRLNERLGAD